MTSVNKIALAAASLKAKNSVRTLQLVFGDVSSSLSSPEFRCVALSDANGI